MRLNTSRTKYTPASKDNDMNDGFSLATFFKLCLIAAISRVSGFKPATLMRYLVTPVLHSSYVKNVIGKLREGVSMNRGWY